MTKTCPGCNPYAASDAEASGVAPQLCPACQWVKDLPKPRAILVLEAVEPLRTIERSRVFRVVEAWEHDDGCDGCDRGHVANRQLSYEAAYLSDSDALGDSVLLWRDATDAEIRQYVLPRLLRYFGRLTWPNTNVRSSLSEIAEGEIDQEERSIARRRALAEIDGQSGDPA